MAGFDPGCVKRNLIWSQCRAEDKFLRFFALRMTVEPKIPGAIIPQSFYTARVSDGRRSNSSQRPLRLAPRRGHCSGGGNVRFVPILLQKSAILVVGLPLRPLEADSDYSFSHWTLVGV